MQKKLWHKQLAEKYIQSVRQCTGTPNQGLYYKSPELSGKCLRRKLTELVEKFLAVGNPIEHEL